jgi:hypothetical protein
VLLWPLSQININGQTENFVSNFQIFKLNLLYLAFSELHEVTVLTLSPAKFWITGEVSTEGIDYSKVGLLSGLLYHASQRRC